MRATVRISPSNPSEVMTLTFEARTIQIDNPTASAILVRLGGTDFPTETSYDRFVPAQTMYQLPVMGGVFAFTFDNVSAIGTPSIPQTTAVINALSGDEKVGAIGSVQPLARSQLEDRNARIIITSFSNVLSPHSLTARITYVVPSLRKFRLEEALLFVRRFSVATAPDFALALVQYAPFGGAASTIMMNVLPITNQIGDMAPGSPEKFTSQFYNPGDTITLDTSDASTGGSVQYTLALKGIEGDL